MIAHKTKAAMPGRLSLNALLKYFKITRLAAGGQRMSQLNFEYADFIQDFVLARMGAPGILRGFNTEVQTSTGRLAYGHHNPLKKNQDGNSRLAQNILNLLNLRNCRGMREPPNPLNHLDYNDSLELANWLILFNSVELTDLDNPLITPRNADGVVRLPQIEVLERINNLVTDGYLVHGSATIGSWRGDAFLYHEENQQSPALDCEPDLAYERVVPQSHEVNRLYLSEPDSQPSLRGEPLHNSLRVTQNKPSLRGLVNYEILVVQKSTCKNFVGHSANENSPVQAKKKGRILPFDTKALIWALSYRQTTENPAVNYKNFVGQLSGSDLAFLRWRRLISPFAAVIKNPAVLSPSSFSFSISSKSSRGSLTESCKERLFFLPVAITETSYLRWCSVYTAKLIIKYLKWCSLTYTLVVFTLSTAKAQLRHKIAKPGSGGTLTGLLTKPLIGVTVMAESQHTQTRPEFTWLFLGTRANDTAAPTVLRTTASTEFEARADFPGWKLTVAARIRTESPFLNSWTCPESMTLWSLHGTDISYLNEMTGGNHA